MVSAVFHDPSGAGLGQQRGVARGMEDGTDHGGLLVIRRPTRHAP